jgi:hypothetical protein
MFYRLIRYCKVYPVHLLSCDFLQTVEQSLANFELAHYMQVPLMCVFFVHKLCRADNIVP